MGGPSTTEPDRASTASEAATVDATNDEVYADPIERRIGRGSAIAVSLAALVLTLLTFVDCSGSASRAVLRVTDLDDITIEQRDLPDLPIRRYTRTFKAYRDWGYASVAFGSDKSAAGAEKYPSGIEQSIIYNDDASDARNHLETERSLSRRRIDQLFTSTPDRADIPVRPGRREVRITRATDGTTVVYELDYVLNNVSMYTVLYGRSDLLTEDRALEISDISLRKFDTIVRRRTLFLEEPYEDWRFETIVDPLVRVFVPLVGFVLFMLFFPISSKTLVVQITVEILSLMLAAMYAFLLWRSIMISGYANVVRLSIDGWLGTLTLVITAALAVMGARLLWRRPTPIHVRRQVSGSVSPTSCPRCRQLSRAARDRCEYCGLEFRGRG
jgi:hypothetical protein